MQVHDTTSAMLKQMDQHPLGLRAERRALELEVWDQIRRTEEEPMEMGTIDNPLLQDHGPGTEGPVSAAEKLSGTGA